MRPQAIAVAALGAEAMPAIVIAGAKGSMSSPAPSTDAPAP
ncbi:MAG: hypothetical protein ABSA02_12510 [Trebonia sp.]